MPSPRRGRVCQGSPSLDFCPRFLIHNSGGLARRVSPCSQSLRDRSDDRDHTRHRRPSDGTHGERVLLRLARSAAGPRVCRSQVAELSRAARPRSLRGELPRRATRRRVATLRDDTPRQVRRRATQAQQSRRAAPRGRARPAGVPHRLAARGGRSHDSRRARRRGSQWRGRTAAVLPRQVPPSGRHPFGSELVTSIPLSRPPVDDEIKQAVLTAMDSRQWILGPQCKEFEKELASYVGVRHCVLTSSATAGLWLTLRSLGVKSGDEVLVPSHTAFPTIEAICVADATPVFVDTDDYYTMDAVDAAARLRRLDTMNERRRQLARRYAKGLDGLPLELPRERPGARHVHHLYVVRTPRRAELAAFLRERGIQTGVHYPVPGHRQPAVEHFAPAPLPQTERLVDEILTLPISAGHTDAEIDTVAMAARAFFGA